jgi:hypothetical protein
VDLPAFTLEQPGIHVKGDFMWLRIVIAGIVGGFLVFCMGAVNHTVFHFQERTFLKIPESATFSSDLTARDLKHGLYLFPDMPTDEEKKDEAQMKAFNERYSKGPSGMLLVVHNGPVLMGENMGKEFVSNVIAAWMAAWIVSLFAADVGFARRWFAVVAMGIFSWISLTASYGIWYRFPHDFVHDELYCALIEWGVAGLVIAAIVRRGPVAAPVSPS